MAIDPDVEVELAKLRKEIAASNEELFSRVKALEVNLGQYQNELDAELVSAVTRILRLENQSAQPPATWQPKFPGDTRPGMLRWGCSYQSNAVPTPHETAAGVAVGLRRTFWRLDQASSVVSTCVADHNAGRLPWVSIKLSDTWEKTARGSADTPLTNLIKRLGDLDLPVWFTVHHEPEGGNGTPYPDEGQGSEVHWRNMQYRVRQLITASNVKNIAFASILMAWTFDSRSKRNPADYWVDGIWDFAGIDSYVEADATTVRSSMWNKAEAFYKEKGLKVALGEWGNKDHGPSGAAEMQAWYDHLGSIGALGACYFDTSLNGGVPLSGDALVKFRELMNHPNSLLVNEF